MPSPEVLEEEIFVLSRQTHQGLVVTWYHNIQDAEALFNTAAKIADEGEEVVLFSMVAPNVLDAVDVRKHAEATAAKKNYMPIRSNSHIGT